MKSDLLSLRNKDDRGPAEMQFGSWIYRRESWSNSGFFGKKFFQPRIQADGIYLELEVVEKGLDKGLSGCPGRYD